MSGRVDIEADNVPELVGELRVLRQLEGADAVRGELMGLENALDRAQADAYRLGQHPPGPVRGLTGRRPKRQIDNALHDLRRQRRLARLARLVAKQPLDTLLHEALLPAPDHRLGTPRAAHDLEGAAAIGSGEDDVGTPHMFLRRATIRNDRLKPTAMFRRDVDCDPCSHAESLNCFGQFGNRPNESDH